MKVCKMTKDVKTMSVAYQFKDAAKTKIQVFVGQFDKTVQDEGLLNGIGAKLADAYAGCEGNCELAVSNFNAVLNELKNGNWRSKSGGGILAEALVMKYPDRGLVECIAAVNTLNDEKKKVLRVHLDREIKQIALDKIKKPEKPIDFEKEFGGLFPSEDDNDE